MEETTTGRMRSHIHLAALFLSFVVERRRRFKRGASVRVKTAFPSFDSTIDSKSESQILADSRARRNHVPLFFARDLLPVPRVSREDKNDWLVFVAPPKFSITPEEMIYVNVGDAIILNCQAEGTPTPEILWYKDANPVEPSSTIGIFNDGTELRISTIKSEDIGDYTCIARNGEGQISHTARVIIAGEYIYI